MIKFLVMDVDGTMTDGMIYMGAKGEAFKSFNIKDGCGIKDILPSKDIIPVVITGRKSEIVEQRCAELDIEYVFQGVINKLSTLRVFLADYGDRKEKLFTLQNCAYIGDDINDLDCMEEIKKEGGLVGAPSDAIQAIKNIADYVTVHGGGKGAIRDFIGYIIKENE